MFLGWGAFYIDNPYMAGVMGVRCTMSASIPPFLPILSSCCAIGCDLTPTPGNRTPVSRVTGGDTSHYTMTDESINLTLTGLEPATFGFEDQCSTIEPQGRNFDVLLCPCCASTHPNHFDSKPLTQQVSGLTPLTCLDPGPLTHEE